MYINSNMCKQMTDVKLLLLHDNTWKHFKKLMSSGSLSGKYIYKSGIFNRYV